MTNIRWEEDFIKVDPPKKLKKITGTRFASVLDANKWASPFSTWCEITKTYEKPFEDTIYTVAGKTIEPKQIQYMRDAYGMTNLVDPTDVYGENFFQKTWGDFFPENRIFGGMWDSLLLDDEGKPDTVLEFKTTKRSEDWYEDIPEYYALQAALYAYLLEVDDVIMICSFLEDGDYEHPENFVPTAENTITREFKVSQRYPNMDELIYFCEDWWKVHVKTGFSPKFDEKRDAEILKALRTQSLSPKTDIQELLGRAEVLKDEIEAVKKSVADKEKELKTLSEVIKKYATERFREGDKKVEIKGNKYTWNIAKTETKSVNKELLEADGLLEKYLTVSTSYKLTVK